jgi:PiT family inorganic phosphate transporter
MANDIIFYLVVAVALGFDFTNGFHDTANSMATTIATGALKPKVAVTIAALINFVGAFLSLTVVATIAKGIVDAGAVTPTIIFAGLAGAIAWNLTTWWFGIPSSSSHALIGGVVGATIVAVGSSAVKFDGIASKVLIPAVIAPLLAGAIASVATLIVYRLIKGFARDRAERGFRWAQIGSSSTVALAHGTNDAQKTMGIIVLAMISTGRLPESGFDVPIWVIVSCATAIAAGTYTGGWRIIKTLGNDVTEVRAPQGFSSESVAATVILASSHFGYPLSTTQVVSGGVTGSGLGRPGASVNWGVMGRIVVGWGLTLPAAAVAGGGAQAVVDLFGSDSAVGPLIVSGVGAVACLLLWRANQRSKIDPETIVEFAPGEPEPVSVPA